MTSRRATVAVLGVVLAIGVPSGFVFAASAGNAHGVPVSTVAKSNTGGTGDAHGDAVSSVAKANAGSTNAANDTKGSDGAGDGSTDGGTAPQHPVNHGAAVSAVAKNHALVGGPHNNHGGAVSAVAHKK